MCLEREAFHRPFPVELQSAQFVATGGSQWKPWHHVYSHTSAGKGQTHKTQYNRCGKYIVRLFYLVKYFIQFYLFEVMKGVIKTGLRVGKVKLIDTKYNI